MINLLANERKSEITAARVNVIFMRYIGITLLAFLFICGAFYLSKTLLDDTMKSAASLIETNDVKAGVYADTEQQVQVLSGQLNEAKSVLDQEIRYSKVLVTIGQLMPAGTILGKVTLSNATFAGTPVELKAYAKNASDASLLQSQFQNSPLFSQVTLQGTDASGGIDGYPVEITMSISLNKAGV